MPTIADQITRLQGAKADLKTSIEGKGVTVPAATKIDGYAALVDQIQQGGGGTTVDPDADVRFFDYDGTLLYTYSAADFANLTELPANPSHTGLTAQGWNWTLADAKTFVAARGILDIGQVYITDDGKTRIYLKVALRRYYELKLNQSVSEGISVDWGDGSAPSTLSGTGDKTFTHTYAADGDYIIAITVASGTMNFPYGGMFPATTANQYMLQSLYKIEIGANVVQLSTGWGMNGGEQWHNLESITIPEGVTQIWGAAFRCTRLRFLVLPKSLAAHQAAFLSNCYLLEGYSFPSGVEEAYFYNSYHIRRVVPANTATVIVTGCSMIKELDLSSCPSVTTVSASNCTALGKVRLPEGMTTGITFGNCYTLTDIVLPSTLNEIPNNAFSNARRLENIIIPSRVTTIGNYVFLNCNLSEITIPDAVTSIGTSAFNGCYLLKVNIGSGITSIGATAFNSALLKEVHIAATTPPTLGSGAFTNLPSDCTIYVPSASLAAYQSATNWSTYASQMVGE